MQIPFTNYHIVKETDDTILGLNELVDVMHEAKAGHSAYGRRKAMRRIVRCVKRLRVVTQCQSLTS